MTAIFADFPTPLDGIPACIGVGRGETWMGRADAPAYVVAVEDIVCSVLDDALTAIEYLLSESLRPDTPELVAAERADPGTVGCLVRHAIQGWVTRTIAE